MNESQMSLYNPKRFKVGDRVRVTERGTVKFGQVGLIEKLGVKADPWDYDYRVSFGGADWGFNDDELELTLLRTAEEGAKLRADEQAALKERATKALDKLTIQEEIDVRKYLKGESE